MASPSKPLVAIAFGVLIAPVLNFWLGWSSQSHVEASLLSSERTQTCTHRDDTSRNDSSSRSLSTESEAFLVLQSNPSLCDESNRAFSVLASASSSSVIPYIFIEGRRFSCNLSEQHSDEEIRKRATSSADKSLQSAQRVFPLSPDEQVSLWEAFYDASIQAQNDVNFFDNDNLVLERILGKERAEMTSAREDEYQTRHDNYMLPWLLGSIAFELELTDKERKDLIAALASHEFRIPDTTKDDAESLWDDDDEIRIRGEVIRWDENFTEEEKTNYEEERHRMADAIFRERIAGAVRPEKVDRVVILLEESYTRSLAALGISAE